MRVPVLVISPVTRSRTRPRTRSSAAHPNGATGSHGEKPGCPATTEYGIVAAVEWAKMVTRSAAVVGGPPANAGAARLLGAG
jgi:hypothetical protein